MSNENKENIGQKQEKQRMWNKILSLFSIGNLKKIWQKIWGKDLPEDITEIFPDDKSKSDVNVNLYNKLKRKLAVKRFFISLAIIICSYIVLNFLFNGIISAIKNNPAIACRNKPVCIYSGPKVKYPSNIINIVTLPDGNLFIAKQYYRNYLTTNKFILKIFSIFNVYIKEKTEEYVQELYDVKKKKFYKLPKSQFQKSYYGITLKNNKILFFERNILEGNNEAEIYDLKNKSFSLKSIKNNTGAPLYYLTKYKNDVLYITNNSDPDYIKKYNGAPPVKSQKEKLYLLNTESLELEKFADFAIEPKFFPIARDIIILENGTMIIPIRFIERVYSEYRKKSEGISIWDHIEIYNPETKRFYAEKNINVLDKNLFYIEKDNGIVTFVNMTSSYHFKDNVFIKTNQSDEIINQYIADTLVDKIKNKWLINIDEPIYNSINTIKPDGNKLLFTCGLFVPIKQRKYFCNETILLDYKNKTIIDGPNIDIEQSTDYIKLQNSEVMLMGGVSPLCGYIHYCPYSKTEIIKIINYPNKISEL